VVRTPFACATLTTGRPATVPAKTTVPGPAAKIGVPAGPARSTPRWPASQGRGGGSKPRETDGVASGHEKARTSDSSRFTRRSLPE
jgi:hypothetical protein